MSGVLGRWWTGFHRELVGESGWILVGKTVAAGFGAIAVILALFEYRAQRQLEHFKGLDEERVRVISDLGADSEGLRVSALRRMPAVFAALVVPPSETGLFARSRAHFAPGLRRELRAFLSDRAATRARLTTRETRALVRALEDIGGSGWYGDTQSPPTSSLSWLWNRRQTPEPDFAGDLLAELQLTGLTYRGGDLTRARLQGVDCLDCDLVRTRLAESDLSRAVVRGGSMEYANLAHADLSGIRFIPSNTPAGRSDDLPCVARGPDCGDCYMRGVTASQAEFRCSRLYRLNLAPRGADSEGPSSGVSADFRMASFSGVTLDDCQCDHVTMSGARFTTGTTALNARFQQADFREAVLDGANLAAAVLDDADLTLSSARKTDLQSTSLCGADFSRADLRQAVLTGARFLTEPSGARIACAKGPKWLNANVAGVVGVSDVEFRLLTTAGAVDIPCDAMWLRYKAAGFPRSRWAAYRDECPSTQRKTRR